MMNGAFACYSYHSLPEMVTGHGGAAAHDPIHQAPATSGTHVFGAPEGLL